MCSVTHIGIELSSIHSPCSHCRVSQRQRLARCNVRHPASTARKTGHFVDVLSHGSVLRTSILPRSRRADVDLILYRTPVCDTVKSFCDFRAPFPMWQMTITVLRPYRLWGKQDRSAVLLTACIL